MTQLEDKLFALVRAAMTGQTFDAPLTDDDWRRLQQWLEQEILHTTTVEQGFNVPSVRFALMMQLAHVQRHFLGGGIGKTTLFRMMLGFNEPTSGQVAVGGELCFVPQGNRPCSSSPTALPSGNCVTRWSDFKP